MADQKSRSTYVTIACKIGLPWIDLQVCEEREVSENTQTGPRTIKQLAKTCTIVSILGTAYPACIVPEGFPDRPQMVLGYALTPNVPRDFWEIWSKQHAKSPYVASGMMFAFDRIEDIKARAADHKGDISGLEPIQRDKAGLADPRISRSVNGNVSNVAPAPWSSAA